MPLRVPQTRTRTRRRVPAPKARTHRRSSRRNRSSVQDRQFRSPAATSLFVRRPRSRRLPLEHLEPVRQREVAGQAHPFQPERIRGIWERDLAAMARPLLVRCPTVPVALGRTRSSSWVATAEHQPFPDRAVPHLSLVVSLSCSHASCPPLDNFSDC